MELIPRLNHCKCNRARNALQVKLTRFQPREPVWAAIDMGTFAGNPGACPVWRIDNAQAPVRPTRKRPAGPPRRLHQPSENPSPRYSRRTSTLLPSSCGVPEKKIRPSAMMYEIG